MIADAFGIVYTGEEAARLKELTHSRSVAATPFGGRYRCIDFIISNMVNSGISNIGVIAQKNYHSLMDHLGSGKEWDLDRKRDGLFMLPPYVTRDNVGLYRGTVEALKSIGGYIRRSTQRYVLFSGSYTIFNRPFGHMIEQHINSGADITIMFNDNDILEEYDQYEDLRLVIGPDGRIVDLELNPYRSQNQNKSCNVVLMEKNLLEYLVEEASAHGLYDFTRDVLQRNVRKLKLFGYHYSGFVARLNSPQAYFKSNIALLKSDVRADLFDDAHPIYTKVKDEVPAKYGPTADVKNSIVASGCIVEGEVRDSLLFRGVYVAKGAKLSNCIVMQGSQIHENASLDCAILDKTVVVKRGRKLHGHEKFPIAIRKGSII
ncbi:MAG: glucose-1-phosphate adenylyltransferase subunit GlgD [Clostridiales bacterium]|jgi:glucose-1-phosphate adenylyltransferase|nr:glucose-1-phosphate adenylyltransferase subunit GlgD [Clostridiales bacterium]